MFVTELLVAVAVIAALVISARSTHIVPAGEVHILMRFGQFRRTLQSGIRWILPGGVALHRVSVRKQRIAIRVPAFTAEGLHVVLDLQMIYAVVDPVKFLTQQQAVAGLPHTMMGVVRADAAGFTLDHLRKALDVANAQFRFSIGDRAGELGIDVHEVTVFDMRVPRELHLHGSAQAIGDAASTMDLIRLDAARELGRRATPVYQMPQRAHPVNPPEPSLPDRHAA